MNADEIKRSIYETKYFGIEQLKSLALLAYEIRQVPDTKTRKSLTVEFEAVHGRCVAVWSRISIRFPEAMNGKLPLSIDGFLAISYMCQLPETASRELFAARVDHLDEPLVHKSVLQDVNAMKPKRGTRDKGNTLVCERCDRIKQLPAYFRKVFLEDITNRAGECADLLEEELEK